MRVRPKGTLEAHQWNKAGDVEGVIVTIPQALRDGDKPKHCEECGKELSEHGTFPLPSDDPNRPTRCVDKVCPGDYIVTGIKGDRFVVSAEAFKLYYEVVEK